MLAQVISGAVLGVDAYLVRVEVDVGTGLPCISVVGLPESAVREGRERVTSALRNSGFGVPPRRITVNLAPADIRKDGSAFDLPIALGLLVGIGQVAECALAEYCVVGELGLDGGLRPVRGVLPLALSCQKERVPNMVVPAANAGEAALVQGVNVYAANSLGDVVRHLCGQSKLHHVPFNVSALKQVEESLAVDDFDDVHGQQHAKRALEIAAAGSHNLILVGPPGAGKSMLARRFASVLPPLSPAEAIEITRIHSVAGRLPPGQDLLTTRPFRAPHHTISEAGLVGGGVTPRPGEVSLAHNGVLFLDELPEFRRRVLEVLRQPMEDGRVTLGRVKQTLIYPARFVLAAAMNPCQCGFYGAGEGACTCHWGQIERYRSRISGPLLDRIDLHVEVPALKAGELTSPPRAENSARIRERVVMARERQLARFRGNAGVFGNAHMNTRQVRRHCVLDRTGQTLIRHAIDGQRLSARAYHRVLKLARTIADLEGVERIAAAHVAEAVQYRPLDRRGTPEERWAS